MKKMLHSNKFIIFLLIITFCFYFTDISLCNQENRDAKIEGNRIITVEGIGSGRDDYELSKQAAVLHAIRNAAQILFGTTIVADIKFMENDGIDNSTDIITTSLPLPGIYHYLGDIIFSKGEYKIHQGKIVNERKNNDGDVEVQMEIELIKSVIDGLAKSTNNEITGLIIDATNIKARPSMYAHIIDETGEDIKLTLYVDRDVAVNLGIHTYVHSMQAALDNKRVKGNPIIVKAIRADGAGRGDLVISNSDAKKIKNLISTSNIIKWCKIVIIIDFKKSDLQ